MDRSESLVEARLGVKRKLSDSEELEINLDLDAPASKKALRKAKKTKTHQISGTAPERLAASLPKPSDGQRSDHGIWIGNLSFSTTKKQVQDFVTADAVYTVHPAQITRVHLPAGNPKHGAFQNKGFAYVDFTDAKSRDNALQLNEKLLEGRRLLIKDAQSFEGRPKTVKAAGKDVVGQTPSCRIFVGNLGFDVTTELLQQHFEQCGPISKVHMATFEDTGKCKGFAWITFETLSAASSAMRGWLELRAEDPAKAQGESSKRRVWINRMEGRKLRMEYAEDATTRYNKRYGKKTTSNENDRAVQDAPTPDGHVVETDGDENNHNITGSNRDLGEHIRRGEETDPVTEPQKRTTRRQPNKRDTGYSQDVVDKLRGSITAGEGQKITFE